MSKKWIVVFPGQGSQKVGMGADLIAQNDHCKEMFQKARSVLGFDIAGACINGPEELLKQTDYAQSGIFVVSACLYHLILERVGRRPDFVLGHSLGEITAYFAAGIFDLETALGVIQARGHAMALACKQVSSEMAAVMGLELTDIQEALVPFQDAPVVAANINSPNQIVISGASKHMPAAIEALKEKGAKRVIPLPVAGGFHSPLMASAAESLSKYLSDVHFAQPTIPVVLNRTAAACADLQELSLNLPQQVVSPVRWVESIQNLANIPNIGFVECGPGSVLTGLIKKISPDTPVVSVDSIAALENLNSII